MKNRLDEMLARAVESSIPEGTGKIAVWASGGIDSSALLYYLRNHDADGIHVYFEDGARSVGLFDEVIEYLGLDGYSFKMTLKDHGFLLPWALPHHEGKMSAFPTLPMFTAMKSHKYDLILHGLGLDELLGGYRQHAEAPHCNFAAVENRFYDELPMRRYNTENAAEKMGLNICAPFIDPELREFCQGLPRRLKTQGSKTKIILREIMTGRIPPENRLEGTFAGSKEGFHPPIRAWFDQGLDAWVRKRLSWRERRRLRGQLWNQLIRANEKMRASLAWDNAEVRP